MVDVFAEVVRAMSKVGICPICDRAFDDHFYKGSNGKLELLPPHCADPTKKKQAA